MIINNKPTYFPTKLTSILLVIFIFWSVFYIKMYWPLFILPLCILPLRKVNRLIVFKNKIVIFKYAWFKKKIIDKVSISENAKNLLLVNMYYTVRGFSVKTGVHSKSVDNYKLFIILQNKKRLELNLPILYNKDEAHRIARYLSKKLNLLVKEDIEEVFNVHKYDDDVFAKSSTDPSMSLKNITKK